MLTFIFVSQNLFHMTYIIHLISSLVWLVLASWSTPVQEPLLVKEWQRDTVMVKPWGKEALSEANKRLVHYPLSPLEASQQLEALALQKNQQYTLNGDTQGVWRLSGDRKTLMLMKGALEGRWLIEEVSEQRLHLSLITQNERIDLVLKAK